jgi:cysteine desulfurase
MVGLIHAGESIGDLGSVGSVESLTYLDHAATTPMRASAIVAMTPFLDQCFANPSGSHRFAREARLALDEARDLVAELCGVGSGEVIFTSCGTESNATVLNGTVLNDTGASHSLCSSAEHHAVLDPVLHAGGQVVSVDATGHIDLAALEVALRSQDNAEISVVSVMAVNNEVGRITDLVAVAAVVRRFAPQAILHCDAVQAACWLDLRRITEVVDAISLSAHKFGGPKGVGILTMREGRKVRPLLRGGGQERDRRSGTHNLAGIVATAEALRVTDSDRSSHSRTVVMLRERLLAGLMRAIPGLHVTIDPEISVPGIVHVCVEEVESEALLFLLDQEGVCASAASACASGAMEPSHVLAAMGVDRQLARGALRLSLGATTTEDDIDRAVLVISDAVDRLRKVPVRR